MSSSALSPLQTHSRRKEDLVRQQADEILKIHGASGTHAEVEALNNILDNVNVRTTNFISKRDNFMSPQNKSIR